MLNQIQDQKQREALFKLSESYEKEDCILMVPHINFVVMKECNRLLREDNEALRAQLTAPNKAMQLAQVLDAAIAKAEQVPIKLQSSESKKDGQ